MADGDFSVKAIVSADTNNFDRGMKNAQSSANSLSKTFQNLSKIISNVAKMAGAAFSVISVVNFGKASVNAAQSATKSLNILSNTIKVTGANAWTTTEQVAKMSNEIAKTTNYAVGEIQDMQSVLLGFKNITGNTFKEANDAITDMATVMGMDLKSAAQTVGKALDDPVKGLDSLRRQGFAFTDQQKKQMKTLVESGNILKAQKMILDELSTTYGGAAKQAQTSFALIQYSMTNLKETLGGKLQPVIDVVLKNSTSAIETLTEKIKNFNIAPIVNLFTNIMNKIGETTSKIKSIVKGAVTWIRDVITSEAFQPIIEILDTIIGTIKEEIEKLKSRILAIINVILLIREKIQSGEGGGIIKTIAGIINKIIDIVWFLKEQIQEIVNSILGIVINVIKNIWEGIKTLFESSNNALANSETDIKSWGDYFYEMFNSVFKTVQDFIGMTKALLNGDWEVAWEYAKLAVMRIAEAVLDTLSTIANAFPKLINGMVAGLNEIIKGANKMREMLHMDPIQLIGEVKNVDLGKATGLDDAIENAEKKIEQLTGKVADYSIKDLKGISAASKGLTKLLLGELDIFTGEYVDSSEKREWETQNEAKTELQIYKDLFKKVSEVSSQAFKNMKTGFTKVGKVFAVVGKAIVSSAITIFSGIKNILSSAFELNISDSLDSLLAFEDSVLTFFTITLPQLPNYVQSVIQSISVLFDNLDVYFESGKFGEVINAVFEVNPMDLISKGISVVTKFLEGVIKGIVDNKDVIFNSLETLFNSILSFIDSLVMKLPNFIIEILPGVLNKVIEFLVSLFSRVGPLASKIVEVLPGLVASIFDNMIVLFEQGLPSLINGLVDVIPNIISSTGKLATTIIQKLPVLLTAIINGLCDIIENLDGEKIGKIFDAVLQMVGDIAEALINNIDTVVTKLIPALFRLFVNIFTAIPEIAVRAIESAWDSLASIGQKLWNAIFGFDENGESNLLTSLKGIKTKVDGIFSDMGNALKKPINAIIKMVNKLIQGLNTISFTIPKWVPGIGGKTFGINIPQIKEFATGTNSAPRGLALVGEAGPELVNFRGGEQVLNNTNTKAAVKDLSSNQGSVFNVTFNNTQDTTAFAMMSQLKQYQRTLAFNGVL